MARFDPDHAMSRSPPSPFSSPLQRLSVQIGVARQLALCGRAAPARKLCGALFLEELPLLAGDAPTLRSFVEAVLLLQMTSLLPRLLRATTGADVVVDVVRQGDAGSRRWTLSFDNGVTLLVVPPGPWLPSDTREAQSAVWARRILETAVDHAIPVATSVLQTA